MVALLSRRRLERDEHPDMAIETPFGRWTDGPVDFAICGPQARLRIMRRQENSRGQSAPRNAGIDFGVGGSALGAGIMRVGRSHDAEVEGRSRSQPLGIARVQLQAEWSWMIVALEHNRP